VFKPTGTGWIKWEWCKQFSLLFNEWNNLKIIWQVLMLAIFSQ
jgi:hypothetical protein